MLISNDDGEVELKTKGFPLRIDIPGFFKGEIKPFFKVKRFPKGLKCKGTIELYNARFTYPPSKRHFTDEELLSLLYFDLKIVARSNVRYYNEYIDVEVKDGSWIILKGRADDLSVGGLALARPGKGKIVFLGTEFLVEEIEVKFTEDGKPPLIFGRAVATIRGKEVYLTHNGRLFEVEPSLSTIEGPLKERDVVGLLRFGHDYSKLSHEELRGLIRSGILRLVGTKISSTLIYPLERRLGDLLGMDVKIGSLFLEDAFSDPSNLKEDNLELTLGRYITEDLYFSYYTKPLRGGNAFRLEVQLPKEESIRYEYDMEKEEYKVILNKRIRF
jgi:hypothetical protein